MISTGQQGFKFHLYTPICAKDYQPATRDLLNFY